MVTVYSLLMSYAEENVFIIPLDISRELTLWYLSGMRLAGLEDKTFYQPMKGLWSGEDGRENNTSEMHNYWKESSEIIQEKKQFSTKRFTHGIFRH